MKCFGKNNFRQLGYSNDNNNRGDHLYEMGSYLPYIKIDSNNIVKKITSFPVYCGETHSWIILNNDIVNVGK